MIHGETSHAISIKRYKCMNGWIWLTPWGNGFSLSNHLCLFFFETWLPIFLSFLGQVFLACHLFSFWGNHNLIFLYFRDVLRERSPKHGAFINMEWMDGCTNSQCRNIAVVALDRGHSRVAESTRLTSEGGYPGRCKLFFRSTHGARTQEHTRS